MIFLFKIKNTKTNKEKTMRDEMNPKKKKKKITEGGCERVAEA